MAQRHFVDVFRDLCEEILESHKTNGGFWQPDRYTTYYSLGVVTGLKKLGILDSRGRHLFAIRKIENLREFYNKPPATTSLEWKNFYAGRLIADLKTHQPIGLQNCLALLDAEAKAADDPMELYEKALCHIAHQMKKGA